MLAVATGLVELFVLVKIQGVNGALVHIFSKVFFFDFTVEQELLIRRFVLIFFV